MLKATMDERARRLWAGTEADAMGWGGIAAVARATGLAISTVTLGRPEVRAGARADDVVKVRRKGGGRHRHEITHPGLVSALEKLVDPVTRGAGLRRHLDRCLVEEDGVIGNTTNRGGLVVRARLDRRNFPTGKKVSEKEMRALNIERDEFHGDWNYVIRPRKVP